MAKILYGVAGEGFGHSSRSELIARHLIESGNDVLFAASGKSMEYLSASFSNIKPVYGLRFAYRNGKVCPFRTVWKNIVGYGQGIKTNIALFRQAARDFKPDLVISDFEPFCAWWAFRHRLPCISIDHEHLLTLGKFKRPSGMLRQRWMAECVTYGYHTFADAYIVLNFFNAPMRGRGVIAPPVVRKIVERFTPSCGEHIAVYFTDSTPASLQDLLDCLTAFNDQSFKVYGFNQEQRIKNCHLKRTSTEGFLADLASSRGVIATAGFSLISECLYYRKPMLLKPVFNQYEQMLNAHYVEKLGLGWQTPTLTKTAVEEFLKNCQKPLHYAQDVLFPDNRAVLQIIRQQASKIGAPLC